MLGLKTIWSKKNVEAESAGTPVPLNSIARQVISTRRPEPRPLPVAESNVPVDTRVAERFVPRRTATVLFTDTGKKLAARIINVSTTGVAVEADFSQFPSQSIVMVGERRVQPGRKITRGTVFVFETPLPQHICGPDLIL